MPQPWAIASRTNQATIRNGGAFSFTIDGAASGPIDQVVLVKNSTITHPIDGGQRNIFLPVIARHGNPITVKAPPDGNVAPPGPYMLFADERTPKGELPRSPSS